jgi:hypothetical protein
MKLQKHTYIILASAVVFLAVYGYSRSSPRTPDTRDELPFATSAATVVQPDAYSDEEALPDAQSPVNAGASPKVVGVDETISVHPTPDPSATPSIVEQDPPTPSKYPWKEAIATVFWAGEGESSDNGYIQNRASAWDEEWSINFGGLDAPDDRCGYRPCSFVPKLNAFYIALPYIERNEDETVKTSARTIPWYTDDLFATGMLLQNHWVEVQVGTISCYAQWKDVGPFETDDYSYVFGSATTPRNTIDARAGIDLSPAMRDCLGVGDVSMVKWRFTDAAHVPNGPWTVTSS